MKANIRILSIVLGCIFILSTISCQQKTNSTVEQDKVLSEAISDAIKSIQFQNDSLKQAYVAALSEIDANLDRIRDEQGYIVLGPNSNSDVGSSTKEQILNNITMISKLLKENKDKIESLEKSLAKYKIGKENIVAQLTEAKEKVKTLEDQIMEIKNLLSEKDFSIAQLNEALDNQNKAIMDLSLKNEEQEKQLNTIYYACGTFKELKDKKIIEKEGGILGIRSTKVVCDNLDKSEFAEMDKFKFTEIPVSGKKLKIITKHPESTYSLERQDDNITKISINDPENFWKVSKYLVVEVR